MRIIALLFFTLAANAQEVDKPIFSTTTHLVVETVTVKDKAGNPIADLTAKDFTVTEDGKPQTIAFAEFQKLSKTKIAPLAAAVAPVSHLRRTQIASETPGDKRFRDHRLLAFYFDMSAMNPEDQIRALDGAQRFIRTQMTESDVLAILQYSGGSVQVLNDFTADRHELLVTIRTLMVGEEQDYSGATTDASASDTGVAFGQNDGEFNLFSTDRQLAALQTAVTMLGRVGEKKTLMYFSSGLRLNGVDNQAQFFATVNAAVRASVSLWPIDSRGLVALAPLGDATRGSPGGVAAYSGIAAAAVSNNLYRSQDSLFALAADTGGRALFDNNDLSQGIVRAQQSVTGYYVIGYYTSNPALDGKMRRIRISVGKELSASLDYRQSFYAGKEFSKFTATDKERQLEEALMQGDPITELTVAVEVNYFQLNRAEYFVPLAVKVPGSELARAKKGGAERTVIDFIGEIKAGQSTVANLRDRIDLKLSGETALELSKRPVAYDAGFTLLPGKYTLKFLARNAETGRIGTYISNFTIPNLNKDEDRLAISSVVLSSQSVDMQDAIYNAKDKLHTQLVNPLVDNGKKMLPSVTRVFSKAKEMTAFVQAYQQGAEPPQPVVAYVSFYQDNKNFFETAPIAVTGAPETRLKTAPLKIQVPLDRLVPGNYTCQVSILNPANNKGAFWQASVWIVP